MAGLQSHASADTILCQKLHSIAHTLEMCDDNSVSEEFIGSVRIL